LKAELHAAKQLSSDMEMSARGETVPLTFDKSAAGRDRAGAATEKLRGGTAQLDDAHKRLEETIDVGSGIMGELDRNRETLQRVRGNVRCAGARRARGSPPLTD